MIKQLQEADLDLVLDYRLRMMVEAGGDHLLADDWRPLTWKLYATGYREGISAHFGWVEEGQVVATAGVMIRDDYPYFTFKARRYGWIMDVYVLPAYRRRGIAKSLTEHTLAWLRAHGVGVARLIASDEARKAGLYERIGFEFGNDMKMRLETPAS